MNYDDRKPTTNGTTLDQATAEAGVDLRAISGQPPIPIVTVEAIARGANGVLELVLSGADHQGSGGTVQIPLLQDIPVYRRLSAVEITANTVVGVDGAVTVYWPDSSLKVNA